MASFSLSSLPFDGNPLSFMRTTFRRLILLFCALRYGARLLWTAAPHHDRLRWLLHLAARLHASASARRSLHRALPELGPLVASIAEEALAHPEAFERSVHEALAALAGAQAALASPLPPAEVMPALTQALGHAPDAAFASIDLVAMESGIAEQIHAASLRGPQEAARPDGGYRRTIVKLLRVKEVERIGDDLAVLGWVTRLLERVLPSARRIGVHAMAQSLGAAVQRRFDLRVEAANLSQTSRHFEQDERVVVPEVVWELSTDHLLVIERIESLSVADLDGLRRHGVDLEALAERVVEVVVEQAFAHGFFHAALDAERLRVSVEPPTFGRLVFGEGKVMATLSEPEREFFVHGAIALFEQDYGRLASMHREAGHVAPNTRDELLGAELRTRAEPHFAAPSERRSPASLLLHLVAAVEPFDGRVSPALALAHQALDRAETIARKLAPGLDIWEVVKGTVKALAREDVGHRGWIKRLSRELPHLTALPRLPNLLAQRLQHLYDDAREQHDATQWLIELRREQRLTRSLLWGFAIGGALLGAAAVWVGG